ncbi:MAG: hypothetical protein E6F93_12745 [Actinobacteria bacterium]|nr:MAG: hypothetical protein E6F93_12745 [Actinomycetota bacterium]
MKVQRTFAATAAGLTFLLAGIALGTAAASPIKWVPVQLGTHQFGRLRAPDAVVAHAGPAEVAFNKRGACGCLDGPQGPMLFDVAPNGSIWLFDVLNHRLLVWQHGRPARPARALALPKLDVRDFAVGRDGTVYLHAVYADPPAGDSGATLWALAPSGKVRWRAQALMGSALRIGSNGVLYSVGARKQDPGAWTPLTTPAGRPLSLAAQRRGTMTFQPLASGVHLVASRLGAHEVHFALVDRSRKVVRAWRVLSKTPLALAQRTLTPALVGGDLVVELDVSRQVRSTLRSEHVVMRLSPTGMRKRFSLDAKTVWGDNGDQPVAALRIGSDGRLYQLRTNPKTGASIARYSLGAA